MSSFNLIGFSVIWITMFLFIMSWMFINSTGKWYIKLVVTLLVFTLLFSVSYIWREIQGTPKKLSDLNGLIVKSYLIKEPTTTEIGNIWLWVVDPARKVLEPLNIVIPYNKDLHKELVENQGLQQGRAQHITQNISGETSEQIKLHDINTYNMKK